MWMRWKLAHLLPNPRVVLVFGSGIHHQQVVVLAEPMHEDVVDECALRRKQRGVVRLPILQLAASFMVMCCMAASEPGPAKLNLAHVAHVE